MRIVTGHAVKFLLALLVTAAPGQRGSLEPDRVGRAGLENDTKLRLAMAFRTEADDSRARCLGRPRDGEVGIEIRSEIPGYRSIQVISAWSVAPLAADCAIRRLGSCWGENRVRIGVVARNTVAYLVGGKEMALIKSGLLARPKGLARRDIPALAVRI